MTTKAQAFAKKHRVRFDPAGGKKITMPGMAINDVEAMKRYVAGTIVEQAKGFYEEKGMEVPDFDRMDRIQKLEALEEFRMKFQESKELLTKHINDAKANKERRDAEKASAKKAGKESTGEQPG